MLYRTFFLGFGFFLGNFRNFEGNFPDPMAFPGNLGGGGGGGHSRKVEINLGARTLYTVLSTEPQ